MPEIEIREYRPSDSIPAITELLHRAYAPLLAKGMRFVATTQDDTTTRERIECGHCLIATKEEKIVGTIAVYRPDPQDPCEYYRRPGLMFFGQFAVDPDLQGEGLGRKLLEKIEAYARQEGARELALDTSERATELIARYEQWGFRVVGGVDWSDTNYRSVVMAKSLL